MNKKETVAVKTTKDGAFKVEQLIESITQKFPNFNIDKKKVSESKTEVFVNFDVDPVHYEVIARIFLTNQIEVRALNADQKDLLRDINQQIIRTARSSAQSIEKLKNKRNMFVLADLEALVNAGNFDKVVEVANDINIYSAEIVQKARELLQETALKCIENWLVVINDKESEVENAIKAYLRIASNQILRNSGKNEVILKAGYGAIFLCAKYPKYRAVLVHICNNPKVHNLVNLKAAVGLARIIKSGNEAIINTIMKDLRLINIRFLTIAGDVAYSELNSEERGLFDEFIDYLKSLTVAG